VTASLNESLSLPFFSRDSIRGAFPKEGGGTSCTT
jgi:hypothetical protein